jgi:hypothetical protein
LLQRFFQIFHSGFPVARFKARQHTVLQMLRHDEPRHLRQRAGRTGELYQQVVAGAALLHHVADAVYLPRDTRKTLCHTA